MGTYTGKDKRLKYLFENGGGGGTTVIANPQGQATDTLNKLQVGSTIYNVPSGGGSVEIVTVTKSMTSTNLGYFTGFTDKDGNALNPDDYILFDISATTSSQYYLGLPFVLSGNYLARMQLALVSAYVEYVKTAITLNVRYSYIKKS